MTRSVIILIACFPASCACTLRDCSDGFSLSFVGPDGALVESFTGRLAFDGTTIEFTCPQPASQGVFCSGNEVSVNDIEPAVVQVDVATADGTLAISEAVELD